MGEVWGRNGRETAVAEWRWGQTVTFCLIIALVLVNTWYLAWIYRIEKKRMAKAKATEGQQKYAEPNGGAEIEASPMSVWCSEKYGSLL